MTNLACYQGATVLVTGSAGFVGRHLCRRLEKLGARVVPFDLAEGKDVRSWDQLAAAVELQPRFVFHLAAQAFVGEGYAAPLTTFHTNTWGTINVLEALRQLHHGKCAVVVVTTDKVYGQSASPAGEGWPLDGICPYSASKVMAERAVECYRRSYFRPDNWIAVATARAGNIVGPGDRPGFGRLVPDALEALRAKRPISVFHAQAVRPWQAIWDVVEGYALLGAALAGPSPDAFTGPFNFGPVHHHSVIDVVERLIAAWGAGTWEPVRRDLHEVDELRISSSKAALLLGWHPRWTFEDMITATVRAYQEALCSGQVAISST